MVKPMDRPPFRFAVQATNAAGGREWRETVRKSKISDTQRFSCRVFCIDYHVPAVLAKEAATLDLLSDGRLEMGIGAGWSETEYNAMGLTFDRPGQRIAKLAEVVSLIKAHWEGGQLDFAGQIVQVRGYAGRPLPVQRPHPPIMIGGGGPRMLAFAGREADIVSMSSVPFVARDADGRDPQLSPGAASRWSGQRQASATVGWKSRVRRTSRRSPTIPKPFWRRQPRLPGFPLTSCASIPT
jgi:hypothetical protein